MLNVTYNDNSKHTFYTGNKISDAFQVKYIQADGDELNRIIFWGYPNHITGVQFYYGEMAIQIALNWN